MGCGGKGEEIEKGTQMLLKRMSFIPDPIVMYFIIQHRVKNIDSLLLLVGWLHYNTTGSCGARYVSYA